MTAAQLSLEGRPTSFLCLREIEARGLLSRQRLAVYKALAEHGPMTGAELDQLLHGARGHLHKRLPELARAGMVRELPARPCAATGHLAIAWEAVDSLPAPTPARPTRLEVFSDALVARLEREPGRTWSAAELADLLRQLAGGAR